MSTLALKSLDDHVGQPLPPEFLADRYNPANDTYYRTLDRLKRSILAHALTMRPKAVKAVKMHLATAGSYVAIGEAVGLTSATVARYIKSPDGQRLADLIQHYQHALDGPNADHRRAVLWRITIDNEVERPATSVAAMAELNKMAGTYKQADQAVTISTTGAGTFTFSMSPQAPEPEPEPEPEPSRLIDGETLPPDV
ncbi:MAG: hypothetical protein GY765_14310 [bacterium]|nr:hypothetical protein [bacterium]